MVANYGNNTSHDGIQILLNNGSGVFTALTQYTSGMNEPDALAVGNFNGDGKPSTWPWPTTGTTSCVLVGNGSSSGTGFSSGTTYSIAAAFRAHQHRGGRSQRRRLARHRRGQLQRSGSTVGILLNNGNGTFADDRARTAPAATSLRASRSPTSTATAIPTWS